MMIETSQKSIEATLGLNAPAAVWKRAGRRLVWAFIVLLIVLVVILATYRGAADTVKYHTVPVASGDMVITVTATGNLQATNEVDVGSELSGIIKTVDVDYNDTVRIGQPLARLDSVKFRAAVQKSKAEVMAAEAQYQQALVTLEETEKKAARYEETRRLTNGRMPSLENLESAQAELNRSRAAVKNTKAAIEKAGAALLSDEADLEKTVIYSPINGIVLSREIDPGQTVAASLQSPVLFTLAEDLRQMELQVDVDEADVGLIKEGLAATFTVDAYPERVFTARITQVRFGSQTTDGVVSYKTLLEVANPDLLLRPGMTATATIVVQKVENALIVPNAALSYSPQTTQVQKKSRGLIASLIPHPRRMSPSKKDTAAEINAAPRVWVLKDDQPVAVKVVKGVSDGVNTAVTGAELKPGMRLILSEMVTNG